MSAGPLLQLAGVRKVYRAGWLAARLAPAAARGLPDEHPGDTVALRGVDLEVHEGEVVGLIGESGCGKTTLARVALGLLSRDAGLVRVLGRDPATLRGGAELALRREAQMLFQDGGASLNPGLSVQDMLAESVRVHAPGDAAAQARRIGRALAAVGLEDRARALPRQLSGGERRRVTLAMLFIARPRLVIADEPTAGLDASRKAEMLDLMLGPRDAAGHVLGTGRSRAFLLISHDVPLVFYACTRVVVMHEGRVVDEFSPNKVQPEARHPWTRELLASAGMARLYGLRGLPTFS